MALLPSTPLEGSVFRFQGNRRYVMQLVSNGEDYGFLSQEYVPPRQQVNTYITTRLEVITRSDFKGVSVQPWTQERLQKMQCDFLQSCVERYRAIPMSMPNEIVQSFLGIDEGTSHDDVRLRALRGEPVASLWPVRQAPRPRSAGCR